MRRSVSSFRAAAAVVALGLSAAAFAQAPAADAVPAKAAVCAACHGVDGKSPQQAAYPILAGQTARYMFLELRDFQAGRRSNPLMSPMVVGMTTDEMHQLSDYYAKQKAPSQTFVADPAKAALGKAKADETLCTMCHLGGFVGQNEIPRVAGQNYDYIVKQLTDFKARERHNDAGSMTSVAGTLSPQDIENLAHYIVGL